MLCAQIIPLFADCDRQERYPITARIGGYRAWPTELRFTLSSRSAGLREILCSWPGAAIGSWP